MLGGRFNVVFVPVFHVSQLRRAVGANEPSLQVPAQLSPEMEMLLTPVAILGVRPGSGKEYDVLIQWDGLPATDATWEAASEIQQQFPNFHLEDKVKVWAVGIDKPPIIFTYSRRKNERARAKDKNKEDVSGGP